MIYIVSRNLLCHIRKNILTTLICIFIISLLGLYVGNIEGTQRQLSQLPEALPVYSRITSLDGSQDVGLDICGELILNLAASNHVHNPVFTVRLMAGIGYFPVEEWRQNLRLSVLGTNSVQSVTGFTDDAIPSGSGTSFDFLESSDFKAMVSQDLMEENQWQIDESISLMLYYYSYSGRLELNIIPLALITFEVIDYFEHDIFTSEYQSIDILVPFETVRAIYHSMDIRFSADSASFQVADPLMLNDFKQEMRSFGLLSIAPKANPSLAGNALSVRDATFITVASGLMQRLTVFLAFLPFVFCIVVFIGHVISYLLIHNRKKEFAVMRTLGASRRKCYSVFFLEQLSVVLAVGFLGSFVAYLFPLIDADSVLVVAAGFASCYLLGTVSALWRLGGINIMKSLYQLD